MATRKLRFLPAAHLVDRVFPEVAVRQYVLSLPFALRYRLAFDKELCTQVLRIFVKTVFSSLKRRARKIFRMRKAYCGSVTFLQRSGGSINLNPHFHSLILDGVYVSSVPYEAPRFHPLRPPTDEEIARVTAAIAWRVEKLLVRRDLLGEDAPTDPDPLEADEPLLSQLYSASVQGGIATGPRAGQRVLWLGDRIDVEEVEAITGPRCASVQGFGLHADVCVPARDRARLEPLDLVGRLAALAPPLTLAPPPGPTDLELGFEEPWPSDERDDGGWRAPRAPRHHGAAGPDLPRASPDGGSSAQQSE